MTKAPYRLTRPRVRTSAVVFCSPHSGCDYTPEFLGASQLDPHVLRSSEDAFVDRLFGDVTALGAPLLAALYPRAFVDLNRGPEELDPALITGLARPSLNPRINSGLGVIPRVVAGGRAIYPQKMPLEHARARLAAVWHPYHRTLVQLLRETRDLYGEVLLVDCHSMPREAVAGVRAASGRRPEIVIGDRFGAAASRDVVEMVETAFQRAGFQVARNTPFAGAYTAHHYGRPSLGQHAVQIEIDRSLYMDERRIEPKPEFVEVKAALMQASAQIARYGGEALPLAAE
ncbi:N-formylglutamate amidohydrolase [Aquimixticola soesokkakensis]|uniref:N-formylglutamate amidohydrolase n=1 Tax=Aquimixticola soesokkakensis TaxID=1519096 RepID=A0A1Y5TNF6_9RHOB|nr:N-formylglutamate amidohydrolase [Aquimixticola soesokkakensis]SLN68162.1 N-formylglutamate amidohydrolase [Aquimixticola soesokkakensis]